MRNANNTRCRRWKCSLKRVVSALLQADDGCVLIGLLALIWFIWQFWNKMRVPSANYGNNLPVSINTLAFAHSIAKRRVAAAAIFFTLHFFIRTCSHFDHVSAIQVKLNAHPFYYNLFVFRWVFGASKHIRANISSYNGHKKHTRMIWHRPWPTINGAG